MKKKIIILLALFIVIFSGCKSKEIVKPNFPVPDDPDPVVENLSFSFIGVGDALLHPGVYMDANTYKVGSNGYYIYDFHNQFSYIKDIIAPYDLKFYNQESIIGGKSLGLSGYPCFNSPDEIGDDLVDIGFNIVSLANNHAYDMGATGVRYSTNYWSKKKNVYTVGSYLSNEERNKPVIKQVNGITYSVLAYTYGTNGIYVPPENSYMVNLWDHFYDDIYQSYKNQIKKDVEAVRDKVDILIVSMHWGNEYQHYTSSYQKDAAQFLSSLGVDVIVGHHPHVVQPIEYVGDTLVIYSLGNFISAQDGTERRIGMMAAFTVNKEVVDGITKEVKVSDVKADLIWTHHSGYQNFKVIPFNKMTDAYLYNYRSIYDQYKGYINPKGDSRIQVGFFK